MKTELWCFGIQKQTRKENHLEMEKEHTVRRNVKLSRKPTSWNTTATQQKKNPKRTARNKMSRESPGGNCEAGKGKCKKWLAVVP